MRPIILFLALLTLFFTSLATAHHGWRWTSETNVEVVGIVESVKLGNPHGILIMNVNGEKWTAEVGQPWRNERAGLTDEMMAVGKELTIEGQRSADANELRVKAELIVINDQRYELYPERL